jgi:hypothetical protein
MGTDWGIYFFVFLVAAILFSRIERLAKQIDAVGILIRAEVARTEADRKQIIADWRLARQEAAKEKRHFWIFWIFVVVLGVAIWLFFKYLPISLFKIWPFGTS